MFSRIIQWLYDQTGVPSAPIKYWDGAENCEIASQYGEACFLMPRKK